MIKPLTVTSISLDSHRYFKKLFRSTWAIASGGPDHEVGLSKKNVIEECHWKTSSHTAYSPDLALSNYHQARSLENNPEKQRDYPLGNIDIWMYISVDREKKIEQGLRPCSERRIRCSKRRQFFWMGYLLPFSLDAFVSTEKLRFRAYRPSISNFRSHRYRPGSNRHSRSKCNEPTRIDVDLLQWIGLGSGTFRV